MPEQPGHPLALTGERTLPGLAEENYWFRRHEVAYLRAARELAGLDVLDAGSGEGYGTALLARSARRAVGVELVPEVHGHAAATYPEAEFLRADLCDLPLPDACMDAVVSFQVIEHLPDVDRYLAEVVRVLRPGGAFWCSTPNRLTFSPDASAPRNPFHVVEFSPDELVEALSPHVAVGQVLGVRHGARLTAIEAEHGRGFAELVLATPPADWPSWLSRAVAGVTAEDFSIGPDAVRSSLDLLAVATTAGRPPRA